MDNLLSTLKGEYARTLILILIPGAIAFEPYAVLLYNLYFIKVTSLKDSIAVLSIIYLLCSVFAGFIIQDIGSRIEIKLDKFYCWKHGLSRDNFYSIFELYLFNERKEEYIITHYYRSLLVRMRFELHTCASIVLLWSGYVIKYFIQDFAIDWTKTIWFAAISIVTFGYLLYEAKEGVKILHKLRKKINDKFKPSLVP